MKTNIPKISCHWPQRMLLTSAAAMLANSLTASAADANRGAYLLPYTRYESENAQRGGGASLQSATQFNQADTAAEASQQKYVSLPSNGSYVEWPAATAGDGVTLRFTLPDSANGQGMNGTLDVYVNGNYDQTIKLSSYWAWQYFPQGQSEPYNTPGGRAMMRFDEMHFRLSHALNKGDTLRLQKNNGDGINYGVDFVELEPVPAARSQPAGYFSITDFGAVANDNNDDLPAMNRALAAAAQSGTGVFLPPGKFVFNDKLLLNANNIGILGAGPWYSQIYFSNPGQFKGGILARASNVKIGNFYMNAINNRRFDDNRAYMIYKGFMGTFTIYVVIALVAHALVWADKPWLPI